VSSNARPYPVLFVLALALACQDDGGGDDDPAPECLTIDYEGCALLYPPSWEQVWQQTLSSSCAGGGSACHGDNAGLSFTEQASAYAGLMHQLVPGDPNCSPLMLRLESADPSVRMPPGNTPLTAGARCSIATWIGSGASPD
jgi:hypothetical protein